MLGSTEAYSTEQLAARLPHARAWLAAASGQLPHIEQLAALHPPEVAPGASSGGGASLPPAPAQQPLPVLRAGLRAPLAVSSAASATSSATALPGQQQQQSALEAPVAARSWRGLVRLGLVQLVSGGHTSLLSSPLAVLSLTRWLRLRC